MRTPTISMAIALWLATTAFVLLLPTHHYTADAVNNLQFIENGDVFELWHTQHLLAQWPGYWLYHLGGISRAWVAMRLAHAALAGLTVALIYLAARDLTRSTPIALMSGLALWLSYGFWHYASDPDIYIPGYAAVALLLWLYIRFLRQPDSGRLWLLSLAGALSILLHQLNLELAGLIGLTLMWLAWRRQIGWAQVVVYAGVCALLPLLLYSVGWLSVSAYLTEQGIEPPGFLAWALRYFGAAEAGEATWGVSGNLRSLPTAGYAWAQSWLISPLAIARLLPVYGVALGIVGVGLAGIVGYGVVGWMRRDSTPPLNPLPVNGEGTLKIASATAPPLYPGGTEYRVLGGRGAGGEGENAAPLIHVERLVAIVCISTLLLNFLSGWWWQAGNLKFYLFMQLHLILLVALGFGAMRGGLLRGIFFTLLIYGLVLAQIFAISYESHGGLFALRDRYPDPTAQTLYFDERSQAVILRYISDHEPQVLPADFCDQPAPSGNVVWIVQADRAENCPSLARIRHALRFRARRETDEWVVYEWGESPN
jgi:hypothetical protein